MKTMMDEARNKQQNGKVNVRVDQYSKDFGFKIQPCMSNRPQTKGKIESQMKVFEIIHAYQGELTIEEFVALIEKINNIENTRMHKSYGKVPVLSIEKEKAHLLPLPQENVQCAYLINEIPVKVNYSSMVNYKGNQYSVPKKYISKIVQLLVDDARIHIYFNTKLIAVHEISTKKLNYHENHYLSLLKDSIKDTQETLEEIAKENLKKLGE